MARPGNSSFAESTGNRRSIAGSAREVRMSEKTKSQWTRRQTLMVGAGMAGVAMMPGFAPLALADDQPPIGTWPAGSSGDSVTIGAAVPRTGAYAVQGEDELKGMQLAVEHINTSHPLIKQIAPKVDKGVLGKQVKLVAADSAAKPNQAVQAQQTFINDSKIVAMTGSTSSAVAVALNKLAQREHVLYLVAISGSNDTTGKDCVRYGFRQCFYGETAACHRPGHAQDLRQQQEGGVYDAGLYLRPHRHQISRRLSEQEWWLEHANQPG